MSSKKLKQNMEKQFQLEKDAMEAYMANTTSANRARMLKALRAAGTSKRVYENQDRVTVQIEFYNHVAESDSILQKEGKNMDKKFKSQGKYIKYEDGKVFRLRAEEHFNAMAGDMKRFKAGDTIKHESKRWEWLNDALKDNSSWIQTVSHTQSSLAYVRIVAISPHSEEAGEGKKYNHKKQKAYAGQLGMEKRMSNRFLRYEGHQF
jgi:hypothetical protein